MKHSVSVSSITDKLIWICLTMFFFFTMCASSITENSGMGKYLLMFPIIIMLVAKILSSGRKIALGFCGYEVYILVFAIFIYSTALWAENPGYAISKGTDTIEILIAMYLIRICIPETNRITNLLKTLIWGNFGVVYYAIFRYGWSYVIDAISSANRLDNTFVNANTLGMSAAFAILISICLLICGKFNLGVIFSIPAFIVLAASGSRKAVLVLCAGFIAVVILKSFDRNNIIHSLLRTLIILIILFAVIYGVSQLPMFEGMSERIQGLINGFTGGGEVDSSTKVRLRLIELGVDLFKRNPLLGIGIDNAKIYAELVVGHFYYLHNNYVELLAGGGIVGTIIYYSIYVTLFIKLWKNRDFKSGEFNAVFVIFILRLILDYGMVSYETKSTYFYLLIFYLAAKKMRLTKNKTNKETVGILTS